jgi:hypothetical protein
MEQEQLIPLHDVCHYHEVEVSFVQSLGAVGLITIHTVEENPFIPLEQVGDLEQLIRLHHDLHINPEGLDVVRNLLEQLTALQSELRNLRRQLDFYRQEENLS